MVRAPYFDKNGVKKGAWSESEDQQLRSYIEKNGYSNWRKLPKLAGLSRCGKSCRLRWMNYLDPTINRGNYTDQEEALIISLHRTLGNKWSKIAAKLPGRSDNDVKNHWHTHLRKRVITPNSPILVSNYGHELVPNTKCSKEKSVLEGLDSKDRDEVELLITVLSSDQSSYDANNEQQSPSSWSSSLDQVGWNCYSPEVVSNEEPVKDFWSIMGDDIFMEHMDLMAGNYDGSLTSGHDTIVIGDCLWQSVQFCGNDNQVRR